MLTFSFHFSLVGIRCSAVNHFLSYSWNGQYTTPTKTKPLMLCKRSASFGKNWPLIWPTRLSLANTQRLLSLSLPPSLPHSFLPSFSICCSVQGCQRTRAVTLKKRRRVGHTHRTLWQCRLRFLWVCHGDQWALTAAGITVLQRKGVYVCACSWGGVGLLGDTRQMPWGDALQLTSWERLNCPSRDGFRP